MRIVRISIGLLAIALGSLLAFGSVQLWSQDLIPDLLRGRAWQHTQVVDIGAGFEPLVRFHGWQAYVVGVVLTFLAFALIWGGVVYGFFRDRKV